MNFVSNIALDTVWSLETIPLGPSSNICLLLSICGNFRFQINTWWHTKHVCVSIKFFSFATLGRRTTGWLFMLCPMEERMMVGSNLETASDYF